jgi:Heavy metal associated domain 2
MCHPAEIKLWYSTEKIFGTSMLEYVHFVPGRLRLKITALRRQRSAAEAAAKVAALPMVTSAVANPLTGSLTINFDRRQLSIGHLWEQLRILGYISEDSPLPGNVRFTPFDGPEAVRFGRVVTAALLEAVVQHSAKALVRALL